MYGRYREPSGQDWDDIELEDEWGGPDMDDNELVNVGPAFA